MMGKVREVKAFYDRESAKYLSERYEAETCEKAAYAARKAIVLDMLKDRSGSILDIGCGPGVFAKELSAMRLRPFFLDISVEMLKRARKAADAEGSRHAWINGEIESLCIRSGSFENAMAIGVIAYAQDTSRTLSEINRILMPGGCLVLQCSNTLCPTANVNALKDRAMRALGIRERGYQFELTSYSFSKLKALLEKAGFEVAEKRSYDFRLPFLEKFSRRFSISLMNRLHNLLCRSGSLGWLGEGYIIKAVKR